MCPLISKVLTGPGPVSRSTTESEDWTKGHNKRENVGECTQDELQSVQAGCRLSRLCPSISLLGEGTAGPGGLVKGCVCHARKEDHVQVSVLEPKFE